MDSHAGYNRQAEEASHAGYYRQAEGGFACRVLQTGRGWIRMQGITDRQIDSS